MQAHGRGTQCSISFKPSTVGLLLQVETGSERLGNKPEFT